MAVAHGAGARLSVRDGVQVRLLRAESAAGFAQEWQGRASLVTPCWCTGAGRALLLDHTAEEITVLLDDYELIGVGGPNAAHSAGELAAANDRDRRRGVVVARGSSNTASPSTPYPYATAAVATAPAPAPDTSGPPCRSSAESRTSCPTRRRSAPTSPLRPKRWGKRSTATACPGSVSAARVARDARPACLPEPLGRRRRLVR